MTLNLTDGSAGIISTVTDDHYTVTALETGGFNDGDTDTDGLIDAGETWKYEATGTIAAHVDGEEDPIVNTVTVSGTDQDLDALASRIIYNNDCHKVNITSSLKKLMLSLTYLLVYFPEYPGKDKGCYCQMDYFPYIVSNHYFAAHNITSNGLYGWGVYRCFVILTKNHQQSLQHLGINVFYYSVLLLASSRLSIWHIVALPIEHRIFFLDINPCLIWLDRRSPVILTSPDVFRR